MSTNTSEDELKNSPSLPIPFPQVVNFCSFIIIYRCLNYHSEKVSLTPSLEIDFVSIDYPIQIEKKIISTVVGGSPGIFLLGNKCCNLGYQSFFSLTQFTENGHLVIISSVTRLQDSISSKARNSDCIKSDLMNNLGSFISQYFQSEH